jgi:hypothetical protein
MYRILQIFQEFKCGAELLPMKIRTKQSQKPIIPVIAFYFSLMFPIWIIPNADKSHNIIAITTTTFKIFLIGLAIGM